MTNKAKLTTIDTKTLESLAKDLAIAAHVLENIHQKILSSLPVKYGGEAWWKKEIAAGLSEIKKGQMATFNNIEALIKDLHSP